VAYNENTPVVTYDPDASKAMLKDAGFVGTVILLPFGKKDETRLTFT
jgi:ABC-type transport system substrate-binding protein